jgi:hypothetical protein
MGTLDRDYEEKRSFYDPSRAPLGEGVKKINRVPTHTLKPLQLDIFKAKENL